MLPKRISRRNITNSPRYSQKTSYTALSIMVTWQAPSADKASKIVLKVVQEDFYNTCKIILIAFAVFLQFFLLFTIYFCNHVTVTVISRKFFTLKSDYKPKLKIRLCYALWFKAWQNENHGKTFRSMPVSLFFVV